MKIITRALKNCWNARAITEELKLFFKEKSVNVHASEKQRDYERVVVDSFYDAVIHNSFAICNIPYNKALSVVCYFFFCDNVDSYELDEDVDNLLKMVMDSLNGIAWVDDKQVVHKEGSKISRSPKEYTRIEITFLEDI